MGSRLAILIGNQTFAESGFAQLRGPHNDVEQLAKVLIDPSRGAFEMPLPPLKDTTRLQILRTMRKTLREATAEDTVLIHYSGHGKPGTDGSLHFAAADSNIEDLPDTAVRASDVHKAAQESRCRAIILLLDCCYAGAIGQAMNAGTRGDIADLLQQQLRHTALDARGLFILTSSTAWQTSQEVEDERDGRVMGRFTRAVVERLTTDTPGLPNEVRFSHLAAHVAAAFTGQDAREFRADAQGDPLIAHRPPSETSEIRCERILTSWVSRGDVPAVVYALAFEALHGRGSSDLAALVRDLLETPGMTPNAFVAAVRSTSPQTSRHQTGRVDQVPQFGHQVRPTSESEAALGADLY